MSQLSRVLTVDCTYCWSACTGMCDALLADVDLYNFFKKGKLICFCICLQLPLRRESRAVPNLYLLNCFYYHMINTLSHRLFTFRQLLFFILLGYIKMTISNCHNIKQLKIIFFIKKTTLYNMLNHMIE